MPHLRPAGRGLKLDEATTRRSVAILGGVVGIVLLIACLNLAGLMQARGIARQHEFSVRAARPCRSRTLRPVDAGRRRGVAKRLQK